MTETFEYFGRRPSPYFQLVENRDDFSRTLSPTLETLRLTVVNNPHGLNQIGDRTEFPTLPQINATPAMAV